MSQQKLLKIAIIHMVILIDQIVETAKSREVCLRVHYHTKS
jgi:hypothetical protein